MKTLPPHSFHIGSSSGRNMEHEERCLAVRSIRTTAVAIDFRVDATTDTDVRVPEADIALILSGHVDLDDDGTVQNIRHCKEHVRDLSNTGLPGLSHLENWPGVVRIPELASNTADGRPCFSNNAGSWRYVDGIVLIIL